MQFINIKNYLIQMVEFGIYSLETIVTDKHFMVKNVYLVQKLFKLPKYLISFLWGLSICVWCIACVIHRSAYQYTQYNPYLSPKANSQLYNSLNIYSYNNYCMTPSIPIIHFKATQLFYVFFFHYYWTLNGHKSSFIIASQLYLVNFFFRRNILIAYRTQSTFL